MPSGTKSLHFLLSALLTAISAALLGYAMSTNWSKTTVDCTGIGTNNGSAAITIGLFEGLLVRDSCPSYGSLKYFSVFIELSRITKTPMILHGLCVCLLALCLLCSVLSILISFYNSVSNPYETFMGPIGVYVCSSTSACLSLLVLIIFVLNITVTTMAEELVPSIEIIASVLLTNKTSQMQVGYFLVIPYMVLSLGAILFIYLYEHTAYTHRREQERPTEDAPKEIMMY